MIELNIDDLQPKFLTGDRVRIVKNITKQKHMDKYTGEEHTIYDIDKHSKTLYENTFPIRIQLSDGVMACFNEEEIERILSK